ncbi:MAG: TfoX/Sxy family protein [Lysobacter sp.]|nr:TfoX/Sxy family protein [Lysobacter sp.]
MAVRDPCIDYLIELLSPLGTATARRMFGGWGVYIDGTMIGLVDDEMLYLKVDEQTRTQFEAAGSAPFVYDSKTRQITMSYWSAPEESMDSSEAMRSWARLAWEAAWRKAEAKSPRRRALQKRG